MQQALWRIKNENSSGRSATRYQKGCSKNQIPSRPGFGPQLLQKTPLEFKQNCKIHQLRNQSFLLNRPQLSTSGWLDGQGRNVQGACHSSISDSQHQELSHNQTIPEVGQLHMQGSEQKYNAEPLIENLLGISRQ